MHRPYRSTALAFGLLLAGSALAQEAEQDGPAPRGHYIEASIPAASTAFRSIGESTSRTFGKVEATLEQTDGGLARMDLSLALARPAVADATHDLWTSKLDARSETFSYEFKGVQARLDQVSVAYDEAFAAALTRAVDELTAEDPAPIVPCTPKKTSALGALAAGGPGGGAKATDNGCPGTDFSQEIARRWDGDPVLEEQLLQIVAGDLGPLTIGYSEAGEPIEYGGALATGGWPKISTYADPAEVVPVEGQGPAGDAWLLPADLVTDMPELAEALDRIDEVAAAAREELSAAAAALPRDDVGNLAQDDATLAKVKAIQTRARGLRTFTEDARAKVGEALWATLAKARRKGKKDGWNDVGLCLNPEVFGGCAGEDKTAEVAEALGADKKLAKALTEITAGLSAPDVSLD